MIKTYTHTLFVLVACFFLQSCFLTKKTTQKKSTAQDEYTKQSIELAFTAKYVDGCAARMKGNFKQSLALFNECHELMPNNIPAKYELATVNRLLGVNDMALKFAKEAADAEPMNEWYQLLLIDCYRTVRQYNDAIKAEEKLIKDFPHKPEFKENLALDFAYIGQYNKAYQLYDQLEKQFGINEQLTINKVKLLQQEKRYSDIETNLKRLIDSDKDNTTYLLYLAEHYENMRQPDKAFQIYQQILQIDPQHPTVHLALSDYYKFKNEDDKSFEELKLAFMNADLEIHTKYNIAKAFFDAFIKYQDMKLQKQSEELIQIMLRVHPTSPEGNSLYAESLLYSRDYEGAAKYYYLSLQKEKNDYENWEKLLRCDKILNRMDSLEKHSFQAMEYFPNQPIVYYNNGIANIRLLNYKKAIQSLKDGLEFVVDDKKLMSDFYLNLGEAYYQTKEFDKSDKSYENALKINSDNAEALNNFAMKITLRNSDLEKAESLSRKSIELKPAEGTYMGTYGLILTKLKRYDDALNWLTKALDILPNDAEILEHIGDVYHEMKNQSEAVKYWKKAVDAGNKSDLLNSKINAKQ